MAHSEEPPEDNTGAETGHDAGISDAPPTHVLAPASSGRAKCRGCGRTIEKGSLRFGEQVENPYTDKHTTLWFHPRCAAFKRPEPLLSLGAALEALPDTAALIELAKHARAHRRISRLDTIEHAASGRAACRHCKERIDRDSLRIKLVYFEAGRFEPSGFLHPRCAQAFCEVDTPGAVMTPLRHFNPDLSDSDRYAVTAQMGAPQEG